MEEAKYKYAGYWPRMWAYNADLLLLLGIFYLLSWVVEQDRLLYWSCLLITIIYHAVFESSPWNATPGKKMMKLQVLTTHGESLTFIQALGRFLLKVVSLAILYIGFIMIGFTRKGQGLHDKLLHTIVVYDEPGD